MQTPPKTQQQGVKMSFLKKKEGGLKFDFRNDVWTRSRVMEYVILRKCFILDSQFCRPLGSLVRSGLHLHLQSGIMFVQTY